MCLLSGAVTNSGPGPEVVAPVAVIVVIIALVILAIFIVFMVRRSVGVWSLKVQQYVIILDFIP